MIHYTFRFFQIISFTILLVACNLLTAQPNTPIVSPPASELLLDSSIFPDGWASESDEKGAIVAGRDFYKPNTPGHSFQEIYRRPNDNEASKKYKIYLDDEFNISGTRQPAVPFVPPPEITFRSNVADEYYFACGVDVTPQCKMLARYRNYFVFMYFDVSTEESHGGLTYSEIEHVLYALETKVSEVFNVSTNATLEK